MGSCRNSGGSDSSTRTRAVSIGCSLIRALAFVGLVWILLVGSPDGGSVAEIAKKQSSFSARSAGKFAGTDRGTVGTEKVVHDPKLDRVAYMSKRRVPNGPDPIHNRRAGKSGKPPGQA